MFEAGLALQPAQRELNNLVELGIVNKEETNNRVYYQVNTDSPFCNPLKEILSRLLKNAHLRRFPHPSSLRRTSKYASFLRISGALHLGIFEQP
jgi:hypothetical protein